MAIGIYKIENLINHKVYIGQSRHISERWRAHRTKYQIDDTHLYRSMRKYGIENFSFTVIEECSIEDLDNREKYWIAYYNSTDENKGYNRTDGGQNSVHCSLTKKQIYDIYDMLKTGMSQQIIADKYNITQQLVSLINLGLSYTQEGIDYPIIQNRNKQNYCIDCGTSIRLESTRCKKCANILKAHQKHSNLPNREELKVMIRTLPFTKIGEKYGVSDNAVRKWCKSRNLPYKKTDIKNYSDEEWELI